MRSSYAPAESAKRCRRPISYLAAATLLSLGFLANSAAQDNGFDLTDTLIPATEIHHGGPPRDGIPAIDHPKFVPAEDATWLAEDDRVLGVRLNDIAKAYPIRILNYHEIVNDNFLDAAVLVSFCPLCGTGMAFSAEIDGRKRSFGVSGLLYNSDVLLYDRETESLWSQIMRQAVSGTMKGSELSQLPLTHTTWQHWRESNPDTLVLSTETGYVRDYSRTPYEGYARSPQVWFPVANSNPKYHPKEMVLGVRINGKTKVYPFVELSKGPPSLVDHFAGNTLKIEFDPRSRSGRAVNLLGEEIPTTIAFWFAWVAFYPDSEIYEGPVRQP